MFQPAFLHPFYLSTFIQSTSKLITPFYIIYLFSIGLEFRQIALISSFRSIVGLICEIPTGVVADLYGKKFSVILWFLLSACTLFFIPLTDNFIWLSLIFCLNALFETLFTGSDNAWVSDTIEKKDPRQMENFFLRRRSIRNLGFVLAGIAWGLVVKHLWMEYLRYIYGIGTIVSALILLFAPDGKKWYKEEGEALRSKTFWQHLKKSFAYVMQHKILRLLFWAMWLFLVVDELVSFIRTPYMEELGFSIENLGYLSSVIGIIGIIVPLGIEKLLHKRKNSALVLSSILGIFSVLLVVAGRYSSLLAIVTMYLLYSFIDDVIFPIDSMLTNKLIEANKRATVLSIKSVIENLSSIIGAPLMGRILWYISFSQGLYFAGGLMLVIVIMYFIIWKKALIFRSKG